MAEGHTPGPSGSMPPDGDRPPVGPPSGPLSGAPSPEHPPPRRRVLLMVLAGGLVLVVGAVGVLIGAGAFGGSERGGGAAPSGSAQRASTPAASTPAVPTPPTSAAPSPTAPDSPLATSPRSSVDVAAFGRTQRYDDGVEVTVSAPAAFTPSAAAAGHTPGNKAMTLQVTVRNGGGERLELAVVLVRARDGEGREASRVFDVEPDLGMGLSGTLLPGRQAVAAYGFDVPPTQDALFDVEVQVGFERPALFWSGTIK
ncbi:hypothetical protein AB0A76_04965 [Streptomyces exfoliatus]|uniref:DUF4352 domain-containing protein n=1 Tax=Streptomyces exfoliatus TaxID=1905 RepID=A0ABV3CQR5_STREX